MANPTHVKFNHQFVALIDMHLYAKNQVYTSNSFSGIKFQKFCHLIGPEHFAFNLRTIFSQTCSFNRIIKVIMVHDLKPKKSTHQQTTFFAKSKKPFLGVFLGIILKIWLSVFYH